MTTVSVSLPEPLEAFAADQAKNGGFANIGDYLRALVDAARNHSETMVEAKLVEGLDSEKIPATADFWSDLRAEASRRRDASH